MTRTSAVYLLRKWCEAKNPAESAHYEERVLAAMMYAPDDREQGPTPAPTIIAPSGSWKYDPDGAIKEPTWTAATPTT
jgi:hypothetical protein